MRFPRNSKIFRGQLDAAPFAGVFFLVLIFLLLHTSLVFTPGVPIRLPQADNLPGTSNRTVVVRVDGSGQLYFQNQIIDERRLKERLRAEVARASDPPTLIVEASGEVKHGMVVHLCDLAQAVGFRDALLATQAHTVPTERPIKP